MLCYYSDFVTGHHYYAAKCNNPPQIAMLIQDGLRMAPKCNNLSTENVIITF